jgi:hypothetical protein
MMMMMMLFFFLFASVHFSLGTTEAFHKVHENAPCRLFLQ